MPEDAVSAARDELLSYLEPGDDYAYVKGKLNDLIAAAEQRGRESAYGRGWNEACEEHGVIDTEVRMQRLCARAEQAEACLRDALPFLEVAAARSNNRQPPWRRARELLGIEES